MKFFSAFFALVFACDCLCQELEQKRLICQMADGDASEPVKIATGKDDSGLKVLPFSLSFARKFLQSAIPVLKNLPAVDSPDEMDPLPIETPTKNVSVTCDVVNSQVKEQMEELLGQVAKLKKVVEELENNAVCPGGVTYLDRCFRLMEIRGKTFNYQKAEDLCNFNGGVLAKFESALVFTTVASYVNDKFSDPKYGNSTMLQAWTGMKYEIATVEIPQGIFPKPGSGQDNELLKKLDTILAWFPGYPKQSLIHDKIALQYRYAGPDRRRIVATGAVNVPRRRRFVPLCQFQMLDWQKPDSVAARLFRFNF